MVECGSVGVALFLECETSGLGGRETLGLNTNHSMGSMQVGRCYMPYYLEYVLGAHPSVQLH